MNAHKMLDLVLNSKEDRRFALSLTCYGPCCGSGSRIQVMDHEDTEGLDDGCCMAHFSGRLGMDDVYEVELLKKMIDDGMTLRQASKALTDVVNSGGKE